MFFDCQPTDTRPLEPEQLNALLAEWEKELYEQAQMKTQLQHAEPAERVN